MVSDTTTPDSFFSLVTGVTETTANETEDGTQNLDIESTQDSSAKPIMSNSPREASDMPHEARRVLVHLMRQGTLLASQNQKLFEQLCRHESGIRRHLSEVWLQLVLDPHAGVAFVATLNSENAEATDDIDGLEDATQLITKRTLSLFDTLLLLVLRKHYQERETAGEQKIIIDIERLEACLTPFLPLTDHGSKDRKKLLVRVKEMVKRKLLASVRGAEDRYEITPVIRYVVSAQFLETMVVEYTRLAALKNGETEQE